ncbi:uncharacterized protein LOC128995374 [Macrosteles quadrilineatus]|uniref:uncharacterized protein LOC128995374 n=1 Tax=Macrosteles quadrilineatus TaxID=74068 RepID=UPI0023E1B91D|nr:uncharacterized protein LOC128995374 [Macrosteles quadrilineatus]
MESVKTFVFFDLETTGLPPSSPKITEIAFIATSKEEILAKHDGIAKENNFGHCYLPRVINKINLAVYPCKMIHPAASAVSGLTNENLEHVKPFDDGLFNILKLFLDRLEKPLCFVAHNGNKFDYPILKSELLKIGKEFPGEIFCVDTLPGFRELLSPKCEENGDVFNDIRPLESTSNVPVSPVAYRAIDLVPKCGFSQEDYDLEMIKTLEVAERITQEYDHFNAKEIEQRIQLEMEKMRKANETTPERKPRTTPYPVGDHAKRKILSDAKKQKPKFTLSAIYERVTKKEFVNAHRAENDALAILECVTAIGLPVIEWMDCNKIPFRSVKKMW